MRCTKGIMANRRVAGGGPDLSIVGWEHYWYAEGSEFKALGLTDTDEVTSWPDEVGTLNAADYGDPNEPTYLASGTLFSGRPAVKCIGGGLRTPAPGSPISQPFSLVAIAAWDDGVGTGGDDTGYLMDGRSSSGRVIFGGYGDSGYGWYYAGGTDRTTSPTQLTRDTPQLMVAYFDGVSSELDINGSTVASGNAGSNSWNGATFFNRYALGGAWSFFGEAVFMGVYDGDVRDDVNWSTFVTAVNDYYGIS